MVRRPVGQSIVLIETAPCMALFYGKTANLKTEN